jgi:hypothetical protein
MRQHYQKGCKSQTNLSVYQKKSSIICSETNAQLQCHTQSDITTKLTCSVISLSALSKKLSLCLIKHYTVKTYGGVDVQIQVFVTSARVAGEWSASCLGHFTLMKRAPGTHWIGGWVGPTTSLDDMKGRKILPLPGLKLQPSTVQPIASCYTDCYPRSSFCA